MVDRNEEPTSKKTEKRLTNTLGRRRLLQLGGAGLAVGALATVGASAGSDDLPNSIVFDATASQEGATYEFLTSGSVATHPDLGSNDTPTDTTSGHVTGTLDREIHAYRFSGTLSYLDVDGTAEVTLLYDDDGSAATDRLEIVATSDGEVDYEIRSSDTVRKVTDNGDRSAGEDDTVTQTDDGTWLVDGSTRNGNGDTYDFLGEIEHFDPPRGDFTLFFNGEETTVAELTGQEVPEDEPETSNPDREHWYSFEATGGEYVDYYLEVEEGGDMIPSTVDDAVIEDDYHWINDDGTKAAGRVQPGETHAYAFDSLVADVTVEHGDVDVTVDGDDSDLDLYPRSMATGDHWKGYFPWHLDGEERTHWYSFEATGEEYVDYYFETEDGGELIPSTVDEAVIDYEYFWIDDDGTRAAGRVQPGETHAYAFDSLVADVTVEHGDVDVTVDGDDSDLDLYPRSMATGDHWKTGFPWQDDDHSAPGGVDGGVVGGGPGYDRTVSSEDADVVVSTKSELSSALSSASSGDVVFVDGDASIDMGSSSYRVGSGVTLASDRGVDGSDGALIYTDREPTELFDMRSGSRFTGLRVRGSSPGSTGGSSSSARAISIWGDDVEVDNCDICGFPLAGIYHNTSVSGSGHVHHNVIRECNRSGLGYGVAVYGGNPLIEYNYFNYNRHSIQADKDPYGYVCRYNHFGPRTTSYVIDMHEPGGTRVEIYNNVVEAWVDEGGRQRAAVGIRGVPDDVATIHDNWFWNPELPLDSPSGRFSGEAIIQVGPDEWTNVEWENITYGEDADVDYSDIIPGYDGGWS